MIDGSFAELVLDYFSRNREHLREFNPLRSENLYKKLGFISKPRPEFLEQNYIYLEITKDVWDK